MLRVLVVDDSTISASLIAKILGGDPAMEVVGMAKNGREAVELTKKLRPDVITMDIHMPLMNGFEATKEIMIERPTPIVIVSASTAVSDTEWAMQALQAGALTLLLKPPGPKAPNFEATARELVDTVKTMADVKVVRHYRRSDPVAPVTLDTALRTSVGYRAVAIATSTGGPPALQVLLGSLPRDFPLPILLVQHIAGGFLKGFADWLDENISLHVRIATDGTRIEPGHVYVAPEDQHMGVLRTGRIVLSDDPEIGGFRPSATFLFDSVAKAFEDKTIAVILTGMGRDGVDGLNTVREKGGITVAQDKESCVVFGMPGVAVAEGLADAVVPIDSIAKYMQSLVTCKTS